MLTHRALTHDARGANSEHRDVNVVTNNCYTLTLSVSHTHIQSTVNSFINVHIIYCIEIDNKVNFLFIFINYYKNNNTL